MRKVLLTAALLGVMFTVSACSRNKDAVSDESSELLAKPEVTQASTKEKDSGSLDSGSTSEDRYKKIQFGEDELFFPNIAETYRKEVSNMQRLLIHWRWIMIFMKKLISLMA